MTTRLYTPEDYATVAAWWALHKQPAVPQQVLPKCGVMVCAESGDPIAAVWLYQDNSVGVAWLAWVVTNAVLEPFVAADAIDCLLGAAETIAREAGYHAVFTWTDCRSLAHKLARNGFMLSCECASCFTKLI